MATLVLRVPTITPAATAQGGHCYILFPDPSITVANLIREKVRSELRKARAGGPDASSLPLLIGYTPGNDPLSEQAAKENAAAAFERGAYLLLVDGQPMTDLDTVISLTHGTLIQFLVPDAADQWSHAAVAEVTA